MNFYVPLYYDGYQQIKFYDFERQHYVGGIAHCDEFVDSRDGTIIKIEDYMHQADLHHLDRERAIIELSWNNLQLAILMKNPY